MTDKTVAIAVDGMEPDLLSRWIEAGELPNLRKIRNEGASGTVRCSSLSSAKQWTTHFTGVGADEHGVDGFTKGNSTRRAGDDAPDSRELVNLSDILVKTYPELLDESGYSVGLLNPLPIWPPLEFEKGFCVSGMLTPPNSDRWVHPESLKKQLDSLGYRIDVRYGDRPYGFVDDTLFDEVDLENLYEDMFDVLDARIATTKHLLSERPTNYFYGLLKSIDIIQHCFWSHMESDHQRYGDTVLESYRRVDELLGWIFEEIEANLLVFSDHGFQTRKRSAPGPIDGLARAVDSRFVVPKSVESLYSKLFKSEAEVGLENPGQTTGVHDDPGVWIAHGPDIERGSSQERRFEDLPPTILSLTGHPIPDAYSGTAIDAVNCESKSENIDLSIRRHLSIDEDDVVSERLHNLGYADMVDDND